MDVLRVPESIVGD